MAYKAMNEIDKAKKFFLQTLSLDATHFDAVLNLAEIYFSEKNYPESLGYYNKALEIDPNNKDVMFLIKRLREAMK